MIQQNDTAARLGSALAQSGPNLNRQLDSNAARYAGQMHPAIRRSIVSADGLTMLRRHRVAQRVPKFIEVPAIGVCDRI